MNKEEWKAEIESQVCVHRSYISSFQTTINILSEMLEERDRVYAEYIESGARPVVNFTSDRGATNLKQNPLLRQWHELNVAALAYLRDLGITPAGLRKIQGYFDDSNTTSATEIMARIKNGTERKAANE